jgi:molybdopterin biosynthesis enzyme MoaB
MRSMSATGFCRNCLGKWLTVAAHELANERPHLAEAPALAGMAYEDVLAEAVYGEPYAAWKEKHGGPAGEEELRLYTESKPLHAKHDKKALRPSVTPPAPPPPSDGCCADLACAPPPAPPPPAALPLPSFSPPLSLSVRVLTVSTRASRGEYPSGDLSTPAVLAALASWAGALPDLELAAEAAGVVPDERGAITEAITRQLRDRGAAGPGSAGPLLVLTTGGTGFSLDDVTPEATRALLLRDLTGPLLARAAGRAGNPLAALSRGAAGVLGGEALVVNLPGSPGGAAEVAREVMPAVAWWLHANRGA